MEKRQGLLQKQGHLRFQRGNNHRTWSRRDAGGSSPIRRVSVSQQEGRNSPIQGWWQLGIMRFIESRSELWMNTPTRFLLECNPYCVVLRGTSRWEPEKLPLGIGQASHALIGWWVVGRAGRYQSQFGSIPSMLPLTLWCTASGLL
jgi:hypothetical protein